MSSATFELDPVAGRVCQLLLAFVFAQAALHKLREPNRFVEALRGYRIVPHVLRFPAAMLLLVIEVATALGMLFPGAARPALASAFAMLGAYTAAIALNLARGRALIDCGCTWGQQRQTLSGWLIVRNAVLMLVALIGLATQGERALTAVDAFTILFASSCLALLYQGTATLVANRPAVAASRRSNG